MDAFELSAVFMVRHPDETTWWAWSRHLPRIWASTNGCGVTSMQACVERPAH